MAITGPGRINTISHRIIHRCARIKTKSELMSKMKCKVCESEIEYRICSTCLKVLSQKYPHKTVDEIVELYSEVDSNE